MYDKTALYEWILGTIAATDALSPDDVRWCASILHRREPTQDGVLQLGPLIEECRTYLSKRKELDPHQDWLAQGRILHKCWILKNTVYRQRRILVACPQRKQHLPDGQNPPNLGGIIAPQEMRCEADQCFGLDHCEARTYFVRKALKSNIYSHILFVDEDQLVPLKALSFLSGLNLPCVGLNYVKKNAMLESIATELRPDSRDIFQNFSVSCDDPTDLTPREVNCLGLGVTLVDVDVLRRLPEPWFAFEREKNADGSEGRVLVGEDSNFCRLIMIHAEAKPYIIPGMVSPHCKFETGEYFGPSWLVDPATRQIRPEQVENYTHFTVDPKTLYEWHDNWDIFEHGPKRKAPPRETPRNFPVSQEIDKMGRRVSA